MKYFIMFKNVLVAIFTCFITFINPIFGGFDSMFKILLVLIFIDFLCGIIKAIINKQLSSQVGMVGILKKVLILAIVALATMIDKLLTENGLNFDLIRNYVILFYCINEAISILENAGQFLPIPEKIKNYLIQLKDEKFKEK